MHWFLVRLQIFYDLILFLFISHLIAIFHHYLLSFLYQFFHRFSAYINHIYIMYYTEVLSYFISSTISLYSFDKLLTRASSSWLIHESINPVHDGGMPKRPPTSFFSLTSANVEARPRNNVNFSFNPIATLMWNFKSVPCASR